MKSIILFVVSALFKYSRQTHLQYIHSPEPKVVVGIQVEPVSGDPLSLSLWCQFSSVATDHTVTWSREGSTLSELKRRYRTTRRIK